MRPPGVELKILKTRFRRKALPDILVLPPEVIQSLSGKMELLDLSPYVQSDIVEIASDLFPTIPSSLLAPVRTEKSLVGLPAQVDSPVLLYNRTWARELGFNDPPTSPAEFKDQVCSAARYNNSLSDRRLHGTGGWLEDDSNSVNLGWLLSVGKSLPFSTADKTQVDSKQVESALLYVKDISASGCSWKGKNPTPEEYFLDRKALVISMPADKIQAFDINVKTAKGKDEWMVLPYPHTAADLNWVPLVSYFVINPSDSNTENLASWMVLKWLSSLEMELKLSLSDGSLPASGANWQAVQQAGTMPSQLVNWMGSVADPVIPPNQPEWVFARDIIHDGFYQAYSNHHNQ